MNLMQVGAVGVGIGVYLAHVEQVWGPVWGPHVRRQQEQWIDVGVKHCVAVGIQIERACSSAEKMLRPLGFM